MTKSLTEEIAQTRLFDDVGTEALERLSGSCNVIEAKPGNVLIEPGKNDAAVYVVLAGRLNVYESSVDQPPCATVEAGECAGAMSIIEGRARTTLVAADIASRLLVVPTDMMWSLMNTSHAMARNMLYSLSGRSRTDSEAIKNSLRSQTDFEKMALVDSLTGLHNRRWLDQAFRRQVVRSLYDEQPITILMIDVDHFADYCNAHGHLSADKTLRTVALILNDKLRPGDLLARFGSDAFAVLLPDTNLINTFTVAERLRRAVAEAKITDAPNLPSVTVSMGYTQLVAGDTIEDMLERADAALRLAKGAGRNCARPG
jgi:diguanylate cyclase (GGDEF)-like protein